MAYSIDSLESADNTSVFEVSATLAERLAGGVYAVYVLDTRVTDGGETKPRGLVNGKLAVLNGYGEVSEGVTVSARSGVVVANEAETSAKASLRAAHGGKRVRTAASPTPDVQQPKIRRIAREDGGMALYIENLKGYMRVKMGKDLSLSDDVSPAVQTDGADDAVRIVVPTKGDSGFYKVMRN